LNAIYHNFIIEAAPEKVFKAVTDPRLFENWWPLRCTGTPAMGEEYNFVFEEPYNWVAAISKFELNRSVYYKMTKSDPDWDPTTFGFELKEHEKGTYLAFFHKDWPQANDHMKYSSFCWAMLLNGLKNYLENGQIIPFEQRA
jgi:uncharacterized protein YndB with AHSA1/START domain